MARIPRLLNTGEATVYHVMSRTALEGFPLEAAEKDYFLELLKKFNKLYFVEVLGFALMGNHFHLLVRMLSETDFSDEEIQQRLQRFFGKDQLVTPLQLLKYREKLGNLSEFVKEIKQGFTRYFNKKRKRFGFFWGQRFKSIIVEDGKTLINCLAYIDLNPIRAGLVRKTEDYRWNTLGYLLQTRNRKGLLCLEFGLPHEEKLTFSQRLEHYRRFVYEIGTLPTGKEAPSIEPSVAKKEAKKGYTLTRRDRFRMRTRYFTNSGVIGSQTFVSKHCQQFRDLFQSIHEKKPIPIQGLEGCFSLKRLAFQGRPP